MADIDIKILTDFQDKRFSFLPTHEIQKRNALTHLHIWLPAHTQSPRTKAAKRANQPNYNIINDI